jgi:hypothetical protein
MFGVVEWVVEGRRQPMWWWWVWWEEEGQCGSIGFASSLCDVIDKHNHDAIKGWGSSNRGSGGDDERDVTSDDGDGNGDGDDDDWEAGDR